MPLTSPEVCVESRVNDRVEGTVCKRDVVGKEVELVKPLR